MPPPLSFSPIASYVPFIMAVTRCVCFQKTFRDVLAVARENGWSTAAEISLNMRCGLGCGGCCLYLQVMLDIGVMCFFVRTDDLLFKLCKPKP
ncbi:MAG TPA: hypothetical protein VHX44_18855, partial [Planctomycetota bacterium]|nr:hypothetical protein [Planctomycetota bacterium]